MTPAPSTGPPPVRRGRPVSPAKRAAILEAATGHFLRDGYEGTSLDAVAGTAGVSKQTVYRHFTDKETLFLAVTAAAREFQRLPWPPDQPILSADDLHASLVDFGDKLLISTMNERVAALRRLTIGELGRRPELHRLWVSAEPNKLGARLATEIAELATAKVIDIPDPLIAVTHLMALLSYPANMMTRYGLDPLTPQTRQNITESAATMFVHAYARRTQDASHH
jgi:TetR/AcrR family transcriptional regulator, mexJK operon transcriptional repressor